ncbi:MAG: hypothetical protein JO219_12080 [Candidatus Eremiobacteraeota bacterium]|nr:hypothetical protein [Candidatus Eremiobacteraeota bacterium]
MIADLTVALHTCPKCRAPGLERRLYAYPILGYSESEFACFMCGLTLWPHMGESPKQSYFRRLMDRFTA